MPSTLSKYRQRYANDPEYRENHKQRAREYRQRIKQDPLRDRILYLCKLIHHDRRFYESLQARADRAFARMLKRIKEREKLREKKKQAKQAKQKKTK